MLMHMVAMKKLIYLDLLTMLARDNIVKHDIVMSSENMDLAIPKKLSLVNNQVNPIYNIYNPIINKNLF